MGKLRVNRKKDAAREAILHQLVVNYGTDPSYMRLLNRMVKTMIREIVDKYYS